MLINIFKQQVCAFWRQVYCIASIVCIAATVRDGVAIGNKGQAGSPCCQRTHARNTDFGLFRDYTALNTLEAIGFSCLFSVF